jgi:hypothetical protein
VAVIRIDPYIVEGGGTLNKGLTVDSVVLFDASLNEGSNFQWEILSKPEDSMALIQAPIETRTRFGPLDQVGVYQVRLWIDRETDNQRSKTVTISVPGTVSPVPLPGEPLFEAGGGRVRNWSFELPGLYPGRADGWQINDEAGILNSQAGITRGRCIPTNFNPESGQYAMVLGDDICLDDGFPVDAKFEVSQVVDLTSIQNLEFDSRFKLCPSAPAHVCSILDSPWRDYWYFNGVDSYLTMPHNADFDVDNGGGALDNGSVLIGFMGTETAAGTEMIVSKTRGTTDAIDGDFYVVITRNGIDQVTWGFRCGAGQNWKQVGVNDYLPNVRTCYSGQRGDAAAIAGYLDDANGTDLGNVAGTITNTNWHGTEPLWLGCGKNALSVPQQFYTGRYYFFYWIKGVLLGANWAKWVLDETFFPWEIYDPATFPQCYINFCQDVAAVYNPEMQSGPNAPYIFTVNGTPVRNGP